MSKQLATSVSIRSVEERFFWQERKGANREGELHSEDNRVVEGAKLPIRLTGVTVHAFSGW